MVSCVAIIHFVNLKVIDEINEIKRHLITELNTYFNGDKADAIEFYFFENRFKRNINFSDVFNIDISEITKILAGNSDLHISENLNNLHKIDALLQSIVGGKTVDQKVHIIFEDTVFCGYSRFGNLRCHDLIFRNVQFRKGGSLKNRGHRFALDVRRLVFRPHELEEDFVIDLGYFANATGLLETDNIGAIRNIEFENHQKGNGRVYFVGLNRYVENASFKNRILDNVVFQNCSLENCRFLNAKLNLTEFRNCLFPQNKNRIFINEIQGRWESYSAALVAFILPFVLIYLNDVHKDTMFYYIFLLGVIPYTLPFLSAINALAHPVEYSLSKIFDGKVSSKTKLNSTKSYHYHLAIRDETEIYKALDDFYHKKTSDDDYTAKKHQINMSLENLHEVYKQLKENFERNDFQRAGSFFYSQRYTEIISGTKFKSFSEYLVLNFHYFVNGFGERFMRPLVWLAVTILLFAVPEILKPNEDYISTPSTPYFLVEGIEEVRPPFKITDKTAFVNYSIIEGIEFNKSKTADKTEAYFAYDNRYDLNYKNQQIFELKKTFATRFSYSVSHMVFPFVPDSKQWFQNVSSKAYILTYIHALALWFFIGAFVLALSHRIKR